MYKKRYSRDDVSRNTTKTFRKHLHILVNRYLSFARTYKNYSDSHCENLEDSLTDFTHFIHRRYKTTAVMINKLEVSDIEAYIAEVSQRPVGRTSRYYGIHTTIHHNTVVKYIYDIKGFFQYCERQGVHTIKPCLIETRRTERAKVSFLTEEERLLLFSCPDMYEVRKATRLRNKIFIMMLYYTGCRISEIINLTFSDIDLQSNQIQIKGKGGKIRGVFITDKIKEMIRDYRQERLKQWTFRGRVVKDIYQSDCIFVSHGEQSFGKPCGLPVFQEMFMRYRKKMAIHKPLSAHTLRHTFATDLMRKGVDVRVAQIMLGHEDISTTIKYTHVSDKMMNDAHVLLCQ